MAKIYKYLSPTTIAGKQQVLVRITINRNNRPRFQTGVYVDPAHFIEGEIVIPKRTKLNQQEVMNAMQEKMQLDSYCKRLESIVYAAIGNISFISREWIISVMNYDDRGLIDKPDGQISYSAICKTFKKMSKHVLSEGEDLEPGMSIYTYLEEYCKAKRLADSRAKNYQSMKRIIFRFVKFEQIVEGRKRFQFDLEALKPEDIHELRKYIMNEGSLYEKFKIIYEKICNEMNTTFPRHSKCRIDYGLGNKSENYAIGILKKLLYLVHWLHEKDILQNDPFAGISIGECRHIRRPVYLTIEERRRLTNFDFSDHPSIAIQRDIFIFQCLVGCRYGDLCRLTPANIHDGVLEYFPQKTRSQRNPPQPRVPLTKTATRLVERYSLADCNGLLFPFLTVQHYNTYLKEAFKLAGLDRIVFVYDAKEDKEVQKPLYEVASSHMARRTFVGNTYKVTKDPCIVSAMSGHCEGSRAFFRYRDIDDDDLREVLSKIDD